LSFADTEGKAQHQLMRVKEMFEMNDDEKIHQANVHKAQGNCFFKLNNFRDAITKYELAHVYLRHVALLKGKDIADSVLPIFSNVALCHLRLNHFAETVDACNDGLKLGGQNAKLLYLRGQARRRRCEFDLAIADLVAAVKLAPNNRQIRLELDDAKAEAKKSSRAEAEMFKGLLQEEAKHKNAEKEKLTIAQSESKSVGDLAKPDVPMNLKKEGAPWWANPLTLTTVGVVGVALGFMLMTRNK